MFSFAIVAALLVLTPAQPSAQGGGGGGRGGPPPTGQAAARTDLTGYWVSVVTEDWLWRMITPPKGDLASVPLNPAGVQAANAWDLAADNAKGEQCKAFGAAAVMRIPGRLHITWQDPNTLKVETDAGTQTRLFHFNGTGGTGTQPTRRTLQGFSAATWETSGPGGGGGGFGSFAAGAGGGLKVVTTQLSPGYLRKNGVPYSQNAGLTEYFDRHTDFGTEWFTVTTVVEDSQYLTQPFITSTHFRKEPDGSKWTPMACHTDPPRTDKPRVN